MSGIQPRVNFSMTSGNAGHVPATGSTYYAQGTTAAPNVSTSGLGRNTYGSGTGVSGNYGNVGYTQPTNVVGNPRVISQGSGYVSNQPTYQQSYVPPATTHQSDYLQQQPTTYTHTQQPSKGNWCGPVCWGLLGLLALASLVLGILFATGVLGKNGVDTSVSNSEKISTPSTNNPDVDIDTSVNTPTATTPTFPAITNQPTTVQPISVPPTWTAFNTPSTTFVSRNFQGQASVSHASATPATTVSHQ